MHTPAVLVLKADRLHADLLRQIVLSILPHAQCLIVTRVNEAKEALHSTAIDLFLTGIGSFEDDVIELIAASARKPRGPRATLVVTSRREPRIIGNLRALPVNGVFDSSIEGAAALTAAIDLVHTGMTYWSRSLLKQAERGSGTNASIYHQLTPTEQLVFSVIGDGSDDEDASTQLGLKPSTVGTIRREIHRKLGIRQRGELVRQAVMLGYVCFSSGKTVRPGYSLLSGACNPRSNRSKRQVNSDEEN